MPSSDSTRCGFVAVVGAPNAGKSTLLNRIIGSKIAIVTPKAQTTRSRMVGVLTEGSVQIAFVDTPGIFAPKRRLDKAMVSAAWQASGDADVTLALIDAERASHAGNVGWNEMAELLEKLAGSGGQLVLAFNKIDLVERTKLLPMIERLDKTGQNDRTFLISAHTGDGVDDLLAYLSDAMPEGPWLYPDDQISDISDRLLAAEITREKLFLFLHEELPYGLTVETEIWERAEDDSLRIGQVVHVARAGHKGIVLGKRGQMIKKIGSAAREELIELMECKVHLSLFVRVTERWMEDRHRFSEMGLEFDV
ncbi:MAG: GTPase Era [Pseudomonadota bacterium]